MMSRLITPALTAALAIAASTAGAQPLSEDANIGAVDTIVTEEQPRRFQIEMLIFSNLANADYSAETWPEQAQLSYPHNIRWFASDEPAIELPETVLSVIDESDDRATEELSADSELVEQAEPTSTHQLIALADEQLQLQDKARSIARQKHFRLLFHKAWQQPVLGRELAPSLQLIGGKQFDQHYELEGSIKISLERYLHIDTDLWLNSFSANTATTDTIGIQPADNKPTTDTTAVQQLPALPSVIFAENAQQQAMNAANEQKNDATADIEQQHLIEQFSTQQTALTAEVSLPESVTVPSYHIERTITLRQHRRMRSEELHYIDHPMFAIVIKIVPLKETELTAEQEPLAIMP